VQERYESAAVEAEAQRYWDKERCFEAGEGSAREKYYCPPMFPSQLKSLGFALDWSPGEVANKRDARIRWVLFWLQNSRGRRAPREIFAWVSNSVTGCPVPKAT
jgi:hypothetical protein